MHPLGQSWFPFGRHEQNVIPIPFKQSLQSWLQYKRQTGLQTWAADLKTLLHPFMLQGLGNTSLTLQDVLNDSPFLIAREDSSVKNKNKMNNFHFDVWKKEKKNSRNKK